MIVSLLEVTSLHTRTNKHWWLESSTLKPNNDHRDSYNAELGGWAEGGGRRAEGRGKRAEGGGQRTEEMQGEKTPICSTLAARMNRSSYSVKVKICDSSPNSSASDAIKIKINK